MLRHLADIQATKDVPSPCELASDRITVLRVIPGESLEQMENTLNEIFEAIGAEYPGFDYYCFGNQINEYRHAEQSEASPAHYLIDSSSLALLRMTIIQVK